MQAITIRNLNFAYPGQPPLFTDCNLDFNSNWRLGLVGRNGRGKTTLLQILQGRRDYRGRVTSKLNFAYFPLRITDQTLLSGDALLAACPNQALEQWQIERELGLLGVDPALLWQPYQTLSGGERTKVQLAALFAQDNVFFLLDEPTNTSTCRDGGRLLLTLPISRAASLLPAMTRTFSTRSLTTPS